jgi:hypothetical protein
MGCPSVIDTGSFLRARFVDRSPEKIRILARRVSLTGVLTHAIFARSRRARLDNRDVLSLPALGALGDCELYALAFLKGTETLRLDRGVMDENVLTVVPAQKSKTLSVVKPLDCALFHDVLLL